MQLSSGKQERSNLCMPDLWCFGNAWHPPFPSIPLAIRTSPAPLAFAAAIADGEEALIQSTAFQLPADSSQPWFKGEMLQKSPQAAQRGVICSQSSDWISTLWAAAPALKAATQGPPPPTVLMYSAPGAEGKWKGSFCVCVKELIERQSTSTP